MYSLNVEQLIPMSFDTVNVSKIHLSNPLADKVGDIINRKYITQGYINVHFLKRLLQIIVDRNHLNEYYVNFDGPDAARAEVNKIILISNIL